MKKLFVMLILIFSNSLMAERTDVHLIAKGQNEVVATLKSKNANEVVFTALENSTSEIEIVLEVDPKTIEKIPPGYRAKFCFEIEENCNWSCRGKYIGRVDSVMPWSKLKLKDLIKKVKSCEAK
jgi:hypothetical protein